MTETFIIHLERASARRPHVETIMQESPYPARIWPACDGAAMDSAARDRLISDVALFQPAYPFSLSMGEVGCFESHRSVWRYMVDNGLQTALILEDDVSIDTPTFSAALTMAEAHIATLGYIQLQVREVKLPFSVVEQSGPTAVIRPHVIPLRTSAQLVSLDAARTLLAACQQIDRPVDGFLQLFWETGVRPHCVVPSGVSDLTQESGGSTVSRKRSLWQKLIAAAKRWTYRNQVATLSRKHT
ncbi:GR25 family glycosyltransferase involved in LPS biosynthesis [Litoreibacter meonggei]|uniref:GR25 family glycosyltransferase involved in LPS biosynthesis n=1 Tax=Litoreibacter meonggei TaxID=1049199 RepID=A0A497VCR3_9RHOB|nr:glycosyltransferase family 25 protein [Litoreibacter meonggei]RLJ41401.1 GR25 family glycosyltransferase involved in LPS biosynthesis [Litoreibacter meonggei]